MTWLTVALKHYSGLGRAVSSDDDEDFIPRSKADYY